MPSTMLADAPSPTPTHSPSPSPSPSPAAPRAPARAGELALLLRQTAAEHGKTLRITALDSTVTAWVERGIADEHLLAALDLAVQDREAKGESAPLNVGFLDVMLAKLLASPKAAPTRVNGHKPWFIESWPAIVAKGAEKGLREADFETPPEFRRAVLNAYGITPEEVRTAEADWGQHA